MAMKVRYNGGTESYYSCSKPDTLVMGKEYEVISINDRGFQTDYTLSGVKGNYNSVWFDKVVSTDKVYMAVSHKIPVLGKSCKCYKLDVSKEKIELKPCSTSVVKEIKYMGNNIYHVTTCNSVYIVNVCK